MIKAEKAISWVQVVMVHNSRLKSWSQKLGIIKRGRAPSLACTGRARPPHGCDRAMRLTASHIFSERED